MSKALSIQYVSELLLDDTFHLLMAIPLCASLLQM